jgi:hypothetical protein
MVRSSVACCVGGSSSILSDLRSTLRLGLVSHFLHGEPEFGDHLFERNPWIVPEPLAGLFDGAR